MERSVINVKQKKFQVKLVESRSVNSSKVRRGEGFGALAACF
jgi:hypothetical protein